jgi:hypothetical protein
VLHTDVANIDWDVAHVECVSDECCKCIVPNVLTVSDVYCTCFIWVLNMFHIYIAIVSHICSKCVIWMLHIFCNGYTRVSWCFRRMLQVFQLFRTYVASFI